MKNKAIYYIGLLLLMILIQSTRFDFWAIRSIKPDFILLLLFIISIREGSIIGTIFGFFGGLAQDLFSNSLLGSGAFAKSLWGYLIGKSNKRFDTNSLIVQIGLIFFISIGDGLLIHHLMDLLNHPVSFKGRLVLVIFGQAIYNALIWPLFYYALERIEKRLRIA